MYPIQDLLWHEVRHCTFAHMCAVVESLEKLRKDDWVKMCFVVSYKYEGVAAGLGTQGSRLWWSPSSVS
jgi:hypothetical protein